MNRDRWILRIFMIPKEKAYLKHHKLKIQKIFKICLIPVQTIFRKPKTFNDNSLFNAYIYLNKLWQLQHYRRVKNKLTT